MEDGGTDDREEVRILFANLRTALPALDELFAKYSDHWSYEDGVYRFYHQSLKVYQRLQPATEEIVAVLRALAPGGRPLNEMFLAIIRDGTGKTFAHEHNT